MKRLERKLVLAGLLGSLVGCSGNTSMSVPTGAERGPCTAGGGCDPGLVCLSRLCVRLPDSALPPGGGAGGGGAGGNPDLGGQAGASGPDGSAGGGAGGGVMIDASLGGAGGTGGTAGAGGKTGAGGSGGSGGLIPTGGSKAPGGAGGSGTGGIVPTGGARASGGTGGSTTGGAGGASCPNVTPCGGAVVGTWTVTSSCLTVTGQLDLSMLGLDCLSGSVTGTLQVSGNWTAVSDGTFTDDTRTTGSEQIALPASCLQVSGVPVTCERLAPLFTAIGYSTASCVAAATGGCSCLALVDQSGGAGLVSVDALSSGSYATVSNVLMTEGGGAQYTYCASGDRMTWTPHSSSPTTAGTILLQRVGGTGAGGAIMIDGAAGAGGATGSDAPLLTGGRPCDIYAAEGGPCVAAHSTVRRLSSTYAGPLYQVRVGGAKSGTGGTTTDIGFLTDGYADGAAQDAACGTDACTISIIYDQSGLGNHLTVAPAGGAKTTPDNEANAKAIPIVVGGHPVYGVKITPGIGYRNNRAIGTAVGDQPETIYMVSSGDYYNGGCCFDYGNAETNSRDNGEGAAEAVYFGTCTIWNKGDGTGPWVMADLENGLWAGDVSPYAGNPSLSYKFVTGMVKGDSTSATWPAGHWSIKVGNAQSGGLATPFDGKRPSTRYVPARKEGGIILGIAGDNSNAAQGQFFEGVMTAHYASPAADEAVQADIVAAGYGN